MKSENIIVQNVFKITKLIFNIKKLYSPVNQKITNRNWKSKATLYNQVFAVARAIYLKLVFTQ